MAYKKSKNTFLTTKKNKVEECIKCLSENGYGVFKIDGADLNEIKVEEMINQLKTLGHKVIKLEENLAKVDVTKITCSDDIVKYFYEMIKRYKYNFDPTKIPNTYDNRKVERSVVNSYLQYRITNSHMSAKAALEELFKIITVLFDVAEDWGVDIKSMGILSVNSNRKFINILLEELKRREDAELSFGVEELIRRNDESSYEEVLLESIAALSKTEPLKVEKKKVKPRRDYGEEKD